MVKWSAALETGRPMRPKIFTVRSFTEQVGDVPVWSKKDYASFKTLPYICNWHSLSRMYALRKPC